MDADAFANHFDPPYDSPIEEYLAWSLSKHLKPEVSLDKQVSFETATCGVFRVDFVAELEGRRIVLECDGREYHDQRRDRKRDIVILMEGHADVVWRFRGSDLFYGTDDCVAILGVRERQLFTDRGLENLKALASSAVRHYAGNWRESFSPGEEEIRLDIPAELGDDTGDRGHVSFERIITRRELTGGTEIEYARLYGEIARRGKAGFARA